MCSAERRCCISHEFVRAASKAPKKVAVIHAFGGARIAAERQSVAVVDLHMDGRNPNRGELLGDAADSSRPRHAVPCEGDECFTFSDVLAAVESLSSRLRCILDGGDDPHLMRPEGDLREGKSLDVPISNLLQPSSSSLGQLIENHNINMPKIVGLHMEPSVEYIIGALSVLRCGEAFLPLDPSWPKERILSVISSSNANLVLSCRSLRERSHTAQHDGSHWLLNCINCPVLCISMNEISAECSTSSDSIWPCENIKQRSLCYLMYTSGSTGKSKGVCGTEAGLLNRFLWMQESYPLHGEEFLLFKTSISFIDHLQEFLAAALTTCTLVIPPFSNLKENPFLVVDFLQVYSIDRLVAVPSLMRAILPAFQSQINVHIKESLKLLVLSGEVLPVVLWVTLSKFLPKTSILNLYGSTEVSGDCTYFDCGRLPMILKTESLSSVPIGRPIANCDVLLVGESDSPCLGELCIGGSCVSIGYLSNLGIISFDVINVSKDLISGHISNEGGRASYVRTGDFAKRLKTGDFVFVGRNDRTVKVNGQRIALEEIESTIRSHADVVDAAVLFCEGHEDFPVLEAFIVPKQKSMSNLSLKSVRSWIIDKLPVAMIPTHFSYIESLPLSSTGKVDYVVLAESSISKVCLQDDVANFYKSDMLAAIKEAFCKALMVEKLSDDDDFFMMGGSSIVAAHAAHTLGIDMRLLYNFPTPAKLQMALLERERVCKINGPHAGHDVNVKPNKVNSMGCFGFKTHWPNPDKHCESSLETIEEKNHEFSFKKLKMHTDSNVTVKGSQQSLFLWSSNPVFLECSFSRCNKVTCGGEYETNYVYEATCLIDFPTNKQGFMRELWKVHMDSCVDASPTVVYKNGDAFLFIGSHSQAFMCVNAKSGAVHWKVELQGRVECSAAVCGDFSQVVVGCYKGRIYFLDFSSGNICWSFQTCGEVKSQPVVDARRHLVWCGSYDHNLYALDYINYSCVHQLPCGGSIYGSPALDEVHDKLYVASTSGRVTALSLKPLKFITLWKHELDVPVFGSLCLSPLHRNVICCLVDGHVIALDARGSIIWKVKTGGPIFAGSCISHTLVSQVIICSRNGSIYSFALGTGSLLWEYSVGQPITASAYVDENLKLLSAPSDPSDRLVCICTSSGSVYLLRVSKYANESNVVHEFAKLSLPGDIFSSPVMIAGRIFVGCRDDYLHCIGLETQL